MLIKKIFIITLLHFIHGCASTSNEEAVALEGGWVSQECIAIDGIDLWVQSTYEFSDTGSLTRNQKGYIDSDCIQEAGGFISGATIKVTFDSSSTISVSGPITYIELGAIQLEEGINGNKVIFNIDIPPEFINIDAYYHITGNNLCFSNAFIVNDKDILFSKVAANAINFTNCLTRAIP